jgi:hypothetical protein
MLSLQRTASHPPAMLPWFAQPVAEPNASHAGFWLKMAANGAPNPLEESSSSAASSCTASTTVPPPLASSSSSGSHAHSFYPTRDEMRRKPTRQTPTTTSTYREPNLPLGTSTFLH